MSDLRDRAGPDVSGVTPEEVYSHIRARMAFEQMVLSVLYGALVSAALTLVLRLAVDLAALNISAGGLVNDILSAMIYAFIVFLTGFLASVVVGIPLFQFLEKRKFRKAWPYFGAALVVTLIFSALAFGGAPALSATPVITLVSLFLPGAVIAALFARRMRAIWAQSAAPPDRRENIVRLH